MFWEGEGRLAGEGLEVAPGGRAAARREARAADERAFVVRLAGAQEIEDCGRELEPGVHKLLSWKDASTRGAWWWCGDGSSHLELR